MYECIGIDFDVDKRVIKDILLDVFSDLQFHYFDEGGTYEIENEESVDSSSINFSLVKTKSEFPVKLQLYGTPEDDTDKRELYLAQIISDRLQCRTITGFLPPDVPKGYPYDSIIFDKGISYLTDDSNTIWADGEGGEVRIIKPFALGNFHFDKSGRFQTGSS